MATLTKSEIAALSVDERIALIDNIWETFEYPQALFTPPDWHKEELNKRLDEADNSPEASIPWEEVKAELMQKWGR
jgi:putative addiction module component (TIGR02574 family)